MKKVLLFNPRSAESKPRIPNSILQVAASVEGLYEYVIVDGNLESKPLEKILSLLDTGEFFCFASTVMPGPQLKQAIPFTKEVKCKHPGIITVWGGYFPSNHPEVVMNSGFVDFIVNGPGDKAFPMLLKEHKERHMLDKIPNLIYMKDGKLIRTKKDELYDQDTLPELPYNKLNDFYSLKRYLGKTYLGTKTIAYHSSFGCPFTCSFCAVVPVYNARWKGRSAGAIYKDIKFLKETYGGNAIEFHDNNFFVSEKRTVEFARLIMNDQMSWWGEGRIDTLDKYSDQSLQLMRDSGCRMIFFGAESGNDAYLKKIDKGGTQNAEQIKAFARRLSKFDIVPEYSFVLGFPAATTDMVKEQVRQEIRFIREIKSINPATEIIIYVYSPVPVEGSEMYQQVQRAGFHYPRSLEEWIAPAWEKFDLRKNPLTPWLTSEIIDEIKGFETVLNGYYPTVSDIRLSSMQRTLMKASATFRYKSGFYRYPLEIKILQKLMKYRQPEIEGF